jgi:hypothetical protein
MPRPCPVTGNDACKVSLCQDSGCYLERLGCLARRLNPDLPAAATPVAVSAVSASPQVYLRVPATPHDDRQGWNNGRHHS